MRNWMETPTLGRGVVLPPYGLALPVGPFVKRAPATGGVPPGSSASRPGGQALKFVSAGAYSRPAESGPSAGDD
jgi:hypothetical protein